MANVLVVGASRGIGLALVRALAARGDEVVATVRKEQDVARLADLADVRLCDVTSDRSVADLEIALRRHRFDLLIHNAGILDGEGLEEPPSSVLRQLDVNAVGAYRVVRCMRGLLTRNAKVALITSRMGSIGDNGSGGYYGYRASKAALNAIGRSLALDLDPVVVLLLHPGAVRTDMTDGHGDVSPEEAAADLLRVIDRAGPEASGRFWHRNGTELPW